MFSNSNITHVMSLLQGEAFVPESIVRIGTREAGRAGVQTLKAADDRIKCVAFA